MLEEKDIFNIVTTNKQNPQEELIEKANEAGGYDNITALIVYND